VISKAAGWKSVCLILTAVMLSACSGSADVADLKQFVDQALAKPRGRIEPIPVFKPYEYFSYSAARLRSPFELPQVVDKSLQAGLSDSNVTPDFDRPKEQLEYYPLGQLSMVGTIRDFDQTLWALVQDADGAVTRIKKGYYMGQNHGRVIGISNNRIDLIEIVPTGLGGWIERPKTVSLHTLDGDG
jgi:type IV pilus assembly protein PilP